MSFGAENLIWRIGRKTIINGVSFETPPGEMLGLLGPNGSGKTSLLRLLTGLKRPQSGKVALDKIDVRNIGQRSIARCVAFIEQHAATNSNLKAIDVVKLGHFPHCSMFSSWSSEDEEAVEAALTRTGMAGNATTDGRVSRVAKSSGSISRALAQSPHELILHEPTNHLDIQHQISLLRLVSDLPITSIIAMQDLHQAAMFCDRLIVLEQGRVVAAERPKEVVTEDLLRQVFHVEARVESSAYHARPHIHYLG